METQLNLKLKYYFNINHMSCLVNRIPEILNLEGIRKDKDLIKYFKNIPKLDQAT